ncbi:hypothetical protein [Candidatus Albibeggiatoa sp. nov. BB20]|uniref:RCC1 domain-containing protein n=1 Tax=Candidatus Albibeggiatoa sp. nov. BB20 TaxID=3162723 RepID=UPI003365A304
MRLLQGLHLILGCLLIFNVTAVEPQIAIAGKTTSIVMILQQDGSLISWGESSAGQLLRETTYQKYVGDINVPILLDIQDVEELLLSTEYPATFVRKTDGTIWYWGEPAPQFTPSPIFPLFDYTKRHIPVLANPLPQGDIKKVIYSSSAGFILTDKNELWISSHNALFYPDIISEASKQANGLVLLTKNVADFSVSFEYVLIVKTDGTVWSLGKNTNGQLGTGDKIAYNIPQKINLSNVKQVVASTGQRFESFFQPDISDNYSLALKNDGTVWAWGSSPYLGIGAAEINDQLTPVQVDIEDVKTLSVFFKHVLALKNDGTVWAWGNNDNGQLGIGTSNSVDEDDFLSQFVTKPIQVLIDDVAAIATGYDFSVAVKNDNSIWTWGNNKRGMLADGTMISHDTPQSIVKNTLYMPEGFIGDNIEEFVALLNTHEEPVDATCSIYYEDGTGFSFPLKLLPEQRSSFSLKDKGVQFYRPFAMVIEPSKRITATFIHYGEGNVALGANFTPVTSKKWSTAQGFYNHEDKVRNYLVGFNPSDESANIELRITGFSDAFPRDINLTVAPKSRFSVKLQDYLNTQIPEQPIGALISSDKEIVVGMTQYDDFLNDGIFIIAEPSWGNTSGYVSEGWLSESGFEVVNVMNPNDTQARISLRNINPYSIFNDIILEPYQQTAIVLKDFLPKNQPLSISVAADYGKNIVANFNHFDLSGLNGVNFSPNAHTHWEFAEGFRGNDVLEFLLIRRISTYYPASDIKVKVKLYYSDGQANAEIDLVIPDREDKVALFLHEDDRVRSNPDQGILYGITIDAEQPVIPYFAHYDFNFGGAFALSGTGWNP